MRRGTALLLSKVFAPRLFKGVPWARHSDNVSLLCYHVIPSMRKQAVAALMFCRAWAAERLRRWTRSYADSQFQLNGPVHGYAVESALEGQIVTIRIEEFTFSEDGELFRSRLEELPQLLLSLFPSSASIQPPSSVRGACSNMRYVPKSGWHFRSFRRNLSDPSWVGAASQTAATVPACRSAR